MPFILRFYCISGLAGKDDWEEARVDMLIQASEDPIFWLEQLPIAKSKEQKVF